LTTVLIGNCSTRMHAHWLITPRGYLGSLGSMDQLKPDF
jgi:precorrin-3B methylase